MQSLQRQGLQFSHKSENIIIFLFPTNTGYNTNTPSFMYTTCNLLIQLLTPVTILVIQ